MSGMDRLTDEELEALEEALHWCEPAVGDDFMVTMAQGRILHRAVCELLAHRRATHADDLRAQNEGADRREPYCWACHYAGDCGQHAQSGGAA